MDTAAEVREYLLELGWVVPDLPTFREKILRWRIWRELNGPYYMTVLSPDFKEGAAEWGLGVPPSDDR